MSTLLGQIKKTEYMGDVILKTQEMAIKEGFSHTSKKWLENCITYDDVYSRIAAGKAETEDLLCSINDVEPVEESGKFYLQYRDGRKFAPTEHALNQMSSWAGTGEWYPKQLSALEHGNDANILAIIMKHGFEKLKIAISKSKRRSEQFLFRTKKDGTLRAMMTSKYAIINNEWFIKIVEEAIPEGRFSHWRGDSDEIWSNVLIPDTIRKEEDSDMGGMISLGNSEIGTRRISSLPSVYRAQCQNGCIWDQETGESIDKVHRGKIDLADLKARFLTNLQSQIPLLTIGISALLDTKKCKFDMDVKPMIAETMNQYKIPDNYGKLILQGYFDELSAYEASTRTRYGLISAFTRAGQKMSNQLWLACDKAGGDLMMNDDRWNKIVGRASGWSAKDIDAIFSTAS